MQPLDAPAPPRSRPLPERRDSEFRVVQTTTEPDDRATPDRQPRISGHSPAPAAFAGTAAAARPMELTVSADAVPARSGGALPSVANFR